MNSVIISELNFNARKNNEWEMTAWEGRRRRACAAATVINTIFGNLCQHSRHVRKSLSVFENTQVMQICPFTEAKITAVTSRA